MTLLESGEELNLSKMEDELAPVSFFESQKKDLVAVSITNAKKSFENRGVAK